MQTTSCNKIRNKPGCVFVGAPYNTLFTTVLAIIKNMTAVVHKDVQMQSYGVGFNASLATNCLVDYEQAIVGWYKTVCICVQCCSGCSDSSAVSPAHQVHVDSLHQALQGHQVGTLQVSRM